MNDITKILDKAQLEEAEYRLREIVVVEKSCEMTKWADQKLDEFVQKYITGIFSR